MEIFRNPVVTKHWIPNGHILFDAIHRSHIKLKLYLSQRNRPTTRASHRMPSAKGRKAFMCMWWTAKPSSCAPMKQRSAYTGRPAHRAPSAWPAVPSDIAANRSGYASNTISASRLGSRRTFRAACLTRCSMFIMRWVLGLLEASCQWGNVADEQFSPNNQRMLVPWIRLIRKQTNKKTFA